MSHSYHPMCGCASCSKYEAALELEEEIKESYIEDLIQLEPWIAQIDLNDEEICNMAKAMKSKKAHLLIGPIIIDSLVRLAEESIRHKVEMNRHRNLSLSNAAKDIYEEYKALEI